MDASTRPPVDRSPNASLRSRSVSRSRRSQGSASNSIRSQSNGRKEALHEESAVDVVSSPPLTSFLNGRHSASSLQESKYLKHAWHLRMVRMVLSVLIIGVAAAVLGCSGDTLRSYNITHLNGAWNLPLWPSNIDLRPTIGVLVPGAIALTASLAYVVVAVIPSPHARTKLLNLVFACTTAVGLVVSIFAVVFNSVLVHDTDPGKRESLQSFTCKFYQGAVSFMDDASKLQIPVYGTINVPIGFKRICLESEIAFWLAVGLLSLELISFAVAATGMWLEKQIAVKREAKYQEKWEAAS